MSGGGVGTGVGSALGTLAGVALAPETGGLSLAIPALTGAAGAEAGNLATGNTVNPLVAALMGGVSGGLGGGFANGDIGSLFSGATGDAGASGVASGLDASSALGTSASGDIGSGLGATGSGDLGSGLSGGSSAATSGGNWGLPDAVGGMQNTAANNATLSSLGIAPSSGAVGGASGTSSMLGNIGTWASKNPLQAALLGETGLAGVQSLLPKPSVNVGQTAAQVEATDPGFNAKLPTYKMQNTASPYQGNWYTYGQQPEAAMYNAQPVLQQAKGGLIKGYAAGGVVSPAARVNPLGSVMPKLGQALSHTAPIMRGGHFPAAHRYAMGGPVMPGATPPQAPQGVPSQPSPQKINPLQLAAVHKMGVAIGQHLKAHGYDPHRTPDGKVKGAGGGQDDAVPARLSQDEYVIPAEAVSQLGDGSSNEGGRKLDEMIHNLRKQKTSKGSGFPPKAKKNPLAYIGGA